MARRHGCAVDGVRPRTRLACTRAEGCVSVTAPAWVPGLIAWKPTTSGSNKMGWTTVPNIADVDNRESLQLAAAVLHSLHVPSAAGPVAPANPGAMLEICVAHDLATSLPQWTPNRLWDVRRNSVVSRFKQYVHLSAMDAAIASDPNLRVTVGRDYLIKPDVTVAIHAGDGDDAAPFLHAAISCKWTIRSDRVQNIRHEFNQLIRHRRGRQPHLVTVTAEPLPTRIAAIARGTGEVDAVYHVAFAELAAAVAASENSSQQSAWDEVVGQGRLLDYSTLGEHIAFW